MPENQAIKENTSRTVDFLWNDVAAVNDDNCCFIISKAMLELTDDMPEIIAVIDTEIVDILGKFKNEALNGEIVTEIECENSCGEDCLKIAVPFLVDYQENLSRGSILEENYAHAKMVDERHILLETVISMPKKVVAMRQLAKIGHFERKNTIKLPADWPEAAEIIGASLHYQRCGFRAENAQPLVEMLGHIGLIYATNSESGEKIVYYEVDEPFSLAIEEPLINAEAGYYALNAQLMNEKEIVLQSFNYLYGEKLTSITAENESDGEIENNIEENEIDDVLQAEAEQADNLRDDLVDDSIDDLLEENTQDSNSKAKEAIKTTRPNRREILEKHMHRLDKGVKTAHIVRNIEFHK